MLFHTDNQTISKTNLNKLFSNNLKILEIALEHMPLHHLHNASDYRQNHF